jgi:signal peptide peptidase SppA
MTTNLTLMQILGEPWAILPAALLSLAECGFASCATGPAAVQTKPALLRRDPGAAAVIPVRGIITNRESLRQQLFGGTSIERLTQQFRRALADRSVKAIVFDVDSPGGEVAGIPELADEIFRSNGKKKIIAVANSSAVAGAFWLASVAGELVVAPSGELGSIGIAAAHEDLSKALENEGVKVTLISAGKYKVDGNDVEPLSHSARQDMQSKVDEYHAWFVNDVARGRGASVARVRSGFGEGRSVLARKAVAMGMADRVATLDQVLAELRSGRNDSDLRALANRRECLREEMAERKPRRSAGRRVDVLKRELERV